ncbi:alpha-amylase/alpha-mannosidase (GH57 family) [Halospina denitrificans]|uniref:Alpha-amylase/alpha-mannosidase (GH57 family) n=1 Tax=Halospina denitrificans TaxID=332522 RepID=A0A4R7JWM7_9GAMM|nr:glycoside hydrolase family 57 protein [Halospina denitrificans]TDT41429.1 alpha-amylase/alpha-mannosidase (GH57 family) [Halospina denitrificans]
MSDECLRVVLCWHMHQPEYRDPLTGEYLAPWTYLHAIKDYVDMAAHLECAPDGVQAVVNFPPVLLEQISSYARRIRDFLEQGCHPGDPLLAALGMEELPETREARRPLFERCLQAHEQLMIERFAPYARLAALTRHALETDIGPDYLTNRHLADLVTWYHLAWLGETVRRRDERVRALMDKAQDYDLADRRQLLTLIGELMTGLLDRYRALVDAGRVELSTTPYTHPMLPLMIDFESAREARPDTPLPESGQYPGGHERALWQLKRARQSFEEHFDLEPVGCWPSEGGVSGPALQLIGESGFRWAASGQGVLRHSLSSESPDSSELHRPYRLEDNGPVCFFRDDELADRIGFNYSHWHGDDAVADFVERLENIADESNGGRVVPVILDGENPWEYYPDNGLHFVPALYRAILQSERLRLTTFSQCLDDAAVPVDPLPTLVAGSWVYGDFNTWIGDPDKNRAWDLLCNAKAVFDERYPHINDAAHRAMALRQLAVCEGSDWFWWFGDYNPQEAVSEFDRLYRRHLTALYELLEAPRPAELDTPISSGGDGAEMGGAMRRSHE